VNITALAKYVPNPSGLPPEIGPDFLLRRAEADGGLDPTDEPGIELAVRLAAEAGGDVRVVSVGPEQAARALVRALAAGAHRATLVTDDSLRGADALSTAKALAAAISREPFDLVIAGVESTDGATGTLPMTLAELLGLPSLTFARKMSVGDGRVRIERQTESGYDVVECELPAIVSVTAAVAVPRYPSVKDNIQARKKQLERLSLAELGRAAADVATIKKVATIEFAPQKQAGELIENEAEALARIVRSLRDAKVL